VETEFRCLVGQDSARLGVLADVPGKVLEPYEELVPGREGGHTVSRSIVVMMIRGIVVMVVMVSMRR